MVVVGAEFIGGVKAEGVSAMLHQHAISDWGVDTIDEKVMKAHAPKESSKSKSNICRRLGLWWVGSYKWYLAGILRAPSVY